MRCTFDEMSKVCYAVAVGVIALCCCFSVCSAATRTIGSMSDFETFVNVFSSASRDTVVLETDLDFSGSSISFPIGSTFRGVFDGKGHSISNLVLDGSNKNDMSFFNDLNGATIQNLVFDESCSITGSQACALSLTASGSLKIYNVTTKATLISRFQMAGGLVCTVSEATSIDVYNFQQNGVVTHKSAGPGPNAAGGLFAFVKFSNDLTINITNSANNGAVNATFSSSGPSASLYVGGFTGIIAGFCENGSPCSLTMTVTNCRNTGDVYADKARESHMGGFFSEIGGIYSNVHPNISFSMTNCSNVELLNLTQCLTPILVDLLERSAISALHPPSL